MKRVCSWCGKDMGEKPPYEDKGVTHTICPECKKRYFPELGGNAMSRYVTIKSTGSLVSWDSWVGELESYLRRGETPPLVEYPPLKCRYCGVVVPKDALNRGAIGVETWAGYHLKAHREAVKELAAKRSPWSAGLVPAEPEPSMMQTEIYHHSPISEHCERVLADLEAGKIPCYSFAKTRSAVLCLAWKMLEDRKLPSLPVGEAWKVLRQKCSLD